MANSVKITKAPTKTVTGLGAPYVSSGHTMGALWKVPNDMTKAKSKSRATSLVVEWTVGMQKSPNKVSNTVATNVTTSELNLDLFIAGTKQYTRNSFYPIASDNKLSSVSVSVKGKNKYGKKKKTGYGKAVTETRTFEVPDSPIISDIALNTTSGVVSTTIAAADVTDYKDRYDTVYTRTVYNSATKTTATSNGSSINSEISVSYDAVAYKGLGDDEYIQVTWKAISRGYAGDSTPAERTIYLAYPAAPVIQSVDVPEGVSGSGDGRITVHFKLEKSDTHPVDGVKLEYAKNTTYQNASDVPDSAFDESGIEDNGDCTSLTMPRSLLEEERGKYSWVRVKSYNADESILYKYSNYWRLDEIFKSAPSAAPQDTAVDIISAVSGADGESAIIQLGWNKSGTDEFTGTEISWSDDENAWRSTREPDHHEFTWSDGRYPPTGTQQYYDSANITIMDLARDTKYHVKARRYLDGDTTTYGAYSDTAEVTPTNKPTKVVPRCPQTIAVGEPLGVYWSFGGGGLQTRWRISNGTQNLANGEGSIGFGQIDADTIKSKATNNTISFQVWVTTGGGETASEEVTVNVIPKPALTVTNLPSTLETNALGFTATCSRPCNLAVTVTSQGISGQTPEGFKAQMAGDVIYSEELSDIQWNNNSAVINLPTGLDFWDGGKYDILIVAVDTKYKLRSESFTDEFTVDWERKAINPDAYVTVTPINDSDVQGVTIQLTPPTGSQSGDVYDIYRMDGSNAHLIGKGFPLTYEVVDEYAPFGGNAYQMTDSTADPSEEGWYEYDSTNDIYLASTDTSVSSSKNYYDVEELFYRVAFRTADGDTEFTDKPYAFPSENIRIDWQGGTLELPYGNAIGDSYSKDVEFRHHMDGTVDGYWNQNIERKGSYSSNLIQLIQPEEINLARALARYAGAVFVRTANGSAYTADVQVTDLSVKNKAVTAIAIDATEVELTEEFMLPIPEEETE